MLAVSEILIQLIGEALRWFRLVFRSTQSIKAENLFLRRQLALYVERGVNQRRVDPVTRISLVFLSRICNWLAALELGIAVSPRTVRKYLPVSAWPTERRLALVGDAEYLVLYLMIRVLEIAADRERQRTARRTCARSASDVISQPYVSEPRCRMSRHRDSCASRDRRCSVAVG
jgi:hypothetical protein